MRGCSIRTTATATASPSPARATRLSRRPTAVAVAGIRWRAEEAAARDAAGGAEAAGPAAWAELQGWKERHRWHPHQLRHAFATRVRALAGLENARVATGHKTTTMTEHYARPERAAVTALLKKIG